ncbi:MAG: YbgA family protein [Thermodesulfobacteriota bacterium]
MEEKIRIGVSFCLLGSKVRYDGGHQHDHFITDTLGKYLDFVSVCPEVECGLPVPRETMRLVGDPENPGLVTFKSNIDYTERMLSWAAQRVRELEQEGLHGFIFKSKSPSCGMERVKVYPDGGKSMIRTGIGMFARAFMEHFPLLPVEDDSRLHDIQLRENFIERIFVYKRWRNLLKTGKSLRGLVDFHVAHKLLIMAHSQGHYRILGRIVAHAGQGAMTNVFAGYEKTLMEALKRKSTARRNADVLFHMLGFFKKQLSAFEKEEMVEIIEQYRKELIPLIVPVTLFRHYIRKFGISYLEGQFYTNPYPLELKLRNHA